MQEDAYGIDHPVCYFSRKFNKHQLNYSTNRERDVSFIIGFAIFDSLCELN